MTVQVIVNQGSLDLSNIPEGTQVVVVQQIVQQKAEPSSSGWEPTNLAEERTVVADNSDYCTHFASARKYRR